MADSQNNVTGSNSIRSAQIHMVCFEYVGNTTLTAQGPITKKRYRFSGPGAVVCVDSRDAPSIAAVPNLAMLKNTRQARRA